MRAPVCHSSATNVSRWRLLSRVHVSVVNGRRRPGGERDATALREAPLTFEAVFEAVLHDDKELLERWVVRVQSSSEAQSRLNQPFNTQLGHVQQREDRSLPSPVSSSSRRVATGSFIPDPGFLLLQPQNPEHVSLLSAAVRLRQRQVVLCGRCHVQVPPRRPRKKSCWSVRTERARVIRLANRERRGGVVEQFSTGDHCDNQQRRNTCNTTGHSDDTPDDSRQPTVVTLPYCKTVGSRCYMMAVSKGADKRLLGGHGRCPYIPVPWRCAYEPADLNRQLGSRRSNCTLRRGGVNGLGGYTKGSTT
ncbi:hypothetical protein EYF80_033476 [Liparis tanakae]|uniref:Uncharacterized protein n=1 Tax=Liparis tanakae TaxID=230148 RepID=A0A4Z2GSQ1_9TELE|nr:hypothetical protein EYF80_033476 [Liparis tanakae]